MTGARPLTLLSAAAVAWATLGWSAVLGFAIWRLGAIAWEALVAPLSTVQWLVLAANTIFMLWAEGYRGFQQRFSPRAAARVLWLRDHARAWSALLAPAFCVGLVGAPPALLRRIWIGAALIVLAVLVVQRLPQPWRGIIDVGVVLGLSWGLLSFLAMVFAALRSGSGPVDPEVATGPWSL